jgi:beta-mannosidase
MNVGIAGGVRLEVIDQARLADVAIHSTPDSALMVGAYVDNLSNAALPVTLRMNVTHANASTNRQEVTSIIPPGTTRLECTVRPDQPQLWWPRGYGDQPLYDVQIELLQDGQLLDIAHRRTAIRTVELRQPPASDHGTLFQVAVNGELVFCKGANWVPADLLWPRVTAGDYAALIDLACEMNCNMLRVWGGGLYESNDFYIACDRAGILVWQDLAFACTTYPADDPAFVAEIEAEVRHNLRRLAHHPSLILWCGNNEIDLGVADGWIACSDETKAANRKLFHETMREWVTAEDPTRPYWPTSPSSPDNSHPNARHTGDQHPWDVGLGAAKGDYWQYRDDTSRFPNEGGVLGPSTPRTLQQILPEAERHIASRTWMHHDNTQNTWRGEPMIDHLLRTNLCNQPRSLSFDDYVRYAAILHGEALETAIDNWRRRKPDTSAAVFWMFNDTWPAVTSWTPIDFYRRRKPAFWYVKRAFQPIRAICVEMDNEVNVFVVNDTLQAQNLRLHYGLFALAGGRPIDEQQDIVCPPNSCVAAAAMPLKLWNDLGTRTHGAFAVLWRGDQCVSTHRLFRERFRDLAWTPATLQTRVTPNGLELSCDTFAWSICLDESGEHPLADNWFDLIPGIPREIPWEKELAAPPATPANPPAAIINPAAT